MIEILEIATVNKNVLHIAINSEWKDSKDAIIYEAAKAANCTVIVTRNTKDFKKADSSMEILLPEELLKMME